MKYYILPFLFLTLTGINLSIAQTTNFEDGFEDKNFTVNPAWSGDANQFTVIEGGPNHLLQLQGNPVGGVSYLSVPSSKVVGYWEFYIELNFSPSGSNYAEIFLMSDIANLEGAVNGYVLQAGEGGSDDVFKIIRYDGGNPATTPVLSGITDISDGGGYRIRVTRSAAGEWTLEVGQEYSGVLQQEATGTDNTYSSTNYFGVKATYTSSRADLFYFDFRIDLPPFTVTDAAVSDSRIIISFNRAYDPASVQSTDFIVDKGIGSPASVDFLSATTLQLDFARSFPSDKYTLSVEGIEDSGGRPIADNTTASFIVYANFAIGDVIINELMYDPPSAQPEYVEIRNLSNKYLNLRNWQIADGSGLATIANETLTLPPNSFLVISSDTAALTSVYGNRPYAETGNFPSLNNGGDALAIVTGSGIQVDSLSYTPGWGGNEVALERRSAIAPPVQANFGNSPNLLGGTPGLVNEVSGDITPPNLLNLIINDSQTLTLAFSERLQSDPATNPGNYSLNSGITVTGAHQIAPDSVRLRLKSTLQNNTSYHLSINNQQDIFGNTAPLDTSFTFYIISPVDSDDIYITEFMYDPPSGFTEYIELYNPTNKSLHLHGWTLNDNSGDPQIITDSQFILPPDSYVVIASDETILSENTDMLLITMGNDFPSFNNGGDDIVIKDSSGIELDYLQYTSRWGGNGVALERRTIGIAPIEANFGEAPNGFGTPGKVNEVAPDIIPPDLVSFTIVDNKSLELVFSEQLEATSGQNESNYTISGDLKISAAVLSADTVRLTLSGKLKNNTVYTISGKNLSDLFGNTAAVDTSFTFFDPSSVDPDDIYINEFMYNPPSGSTEYIELYNPTNKSFNLQGWTLNDNSGAPQVITDSQFIIAPKSFVVLAPDSTLLEEFPNIILLQMGSDFPSFNNSGDDIVVRSAEGLHLDSLRYSDSWGGDNIALERRTIKVAPIEANFGEAPGGFGTPGGDNEVKADKIPPKLEAFIITGNKSLELVFSEQLTAPSAENEDNYAISGSLNIAAAILSADTVRLTLSGKLKNNTGYTITGKNLRDLFGNTATVDTTFTFFDPSPVDPDDIYINEFMYNPPSGSTEYIELYNPTNKSFNLQGWTLNDNSGDPQVIIDSQFIIAPKSYVVLAPDGTLLEEFPNITLLQMGSDFPSFNNSGDNIVVRSAGRLLLDSLQYTDSWGGSEIALERRSINAPPLRPNFDEAPNGFGTPGSENLIKPDTDPPILNRVEVINASKIQLLFSENISGGSAAIKSNYTFSPVVNIQLIAAVNNKIVLHLKQELESDVVYTLTIRNLKDIFGNKLSEVNKEIVFIKVTAAQPKDIVINEFLVNGEPEFIEFYNRSDRNIDLSGWSVGDLNNRAIINKNVNPAFSVSNPAPASAAQKSTVPVDQTLILHPGQYLVATSSASLAKTLDNGVYVSNLPSFNDGKDVITIQNKAGLTIDSLTYTPAFGSATEGMSAERKAPDAASNDPFNWITTDSNKGYTAGAKNSQFQPDTESPEIIFAKLFANGDVEVRFNEFIEKTSELAFTVNQQSVDIDAFNPTAGNTIILNTSNITPGKELIVEAVDVSDVSGNVTSSTMLEVAQLLTKGAVVINEILFDPIKASDDGLDDQSEYIELYNTQDYAISLENIYIHNAPDEDGDIDKLVPVNTRSKWIPGGGTAIIYASEVSEFSKTNISAFFNLTETPKRSRIRIEANSLSLSSSEDAIYLTGKEGIEIDSVFYSETWHNPNIIDTDGIALERINPQGASNDPANWGSSTAPKGGTPYAENTLFQTPVEVERESGISFSTNPFSPDGDGFEDNLIISYKLNQADYLMTVKIYDRYGRLIIELADSKPAGTKGTLTWNGLNENGNRNRIGIYIVIFRAFDSTNGEDIAFKETVVLARRLN